MIDHHTIKAMRRYGGSFIRALAEAANHADQDNQIRLLAAFPEYFAKYAAVAAYGNGKADLDDPPPEDREGGSC